MRRHLGRALVLTVLLLGLNLVGMGASSAAPEDNVMPMPMAGQSDWQSAGSILAHCDGCAPDALFDCDGCEITAGIKIRARSRVDWAANVPIQTLGGTPKQGSPTYVFNSMKQATGEGLKITFEVPYTVGLFACGGSFRPCGDKTADDWQSTNYTDTTTKTMTATTTCQPVAGTTTCPYSTWTNVVPETCFLPGCPVDITVNLHVDGTVTVDKEGTVVARTATFSTGTGDVSTKKSVWAKGGDTPDQIDVPCNATPGTKLRYKVGAPALYAPDVQAEGALRIYLDVDGPGPLNVHEWFDLRRGLLHKAGMHLWNRDVFHVYELGTVQPDTVVPKVTDVTQSGDYVEGSDLTFGAAVDDNCPDSLTYEWSFTDGGTATGKTVTHAFADNGSYGGKVLVRDAAGNSTEQMFDLKQPVANAAPVIAPIAAKRQVWDVPVEFHAEATDPGSADQASLKYAWDFGDGSTAEGADAKHTYQNPGQYPAKVTVTDKDGASQTADVQVTIIKRPTTTTYTGPRHSLPLIPVALTATVADSQGQPVAGAVVTFKLGNQSLTDRTDDKGRAWVLMIPGVILGDTTVSASVAATDRYEASTDGPHKYHVGILAAGG